ncbi:MAG TPA: hypothetical protein VFI25_18835 [Planctomycetota bacterium]|jgi:hypothetical protein|nr:hypothetical protein [Planctomycetota bacterium]
MALREMLWGSIALAVGAQEEGPQPIRVTEKTRADPGALAALEKPGRVFFSDDFESADSRKGFFEIRGEKEGRARLTEDPKEAHRGKGAFRFTAPAVQGKSSGSGASAWLGSEGYGQVYFRRYVKFAADYDQGDLHHVGGSLSGLAGDDRWRGMGSAGLRPKGDDHFSASFEPWRDWGRVRPPGAMFLYTYWMDMKRDRDGHYWGNNLGPTAGDSVTLQPDRWHCLEHMIKVNEVGRADGELAAWVDGRLAIRYTGIRWRSAEDVRLKRWEIGIYVHHATRENTVWYDDVALSMGYVGPIREVAR